MSRVLITAEAALEKVTGSISGRLAQRRLNRKMRGLVRPDDVFFVGHPKSGNTWMALMLAVLKNSANTEVVNTANVGQHIPVIHARDLAIADYPDLSSPRIFRNEGPSFPDTYPKTLYIVRDPRSALVSYFHHCKHDTRNEEWQMDDFIKEMLEFGCIRSLEPFLVRWDRQVLDWHKRRQRQPVHFVRYEDLKADCLTELRKVAEFVGLKVSDSLLKTAVDRGSFTEMRKQEVEHGAEAFAGEKGSRGFFVRTGKVDGWRDELSPASIRKIEQAFAPSMELMGYRRAT